MKINLRYLSILLMASFILSACGPSQAALDSTATKVAADIFGSQTASAPTATSTYTPSPTVTLTPTPTSTPTPALTPTPTSTPTPTPGPDLTSFELTLEDLPAGFEQMPPDMLESLVAGLPEGSTGFVFGEPIKQQFIMGILIPIATKAEETVYDSILPQFVDVMATSVQANTNPKEITGLDDIGNSRAGLTSTGVMDNTTIRWDIVAFRRGSVLAVLLVGYPGGNKSVKPVADIARLLDERISQKLALEGTLLAITWRDDFDGELKNEWTWLNENPERWNLLEKPGFLRIYTSPFASFKENLLLRPVATADFMIETHLYYEPDANFQIAALVIYQDNSNMLAFGRAFCDIQKTCVGNGLYFDYTQAGSQSDGNYATSVDNKGEAYLRLLRLGSLVTAYYSPDGTDWSEIGKHVISTNFKVNGVGLTASQNITATDQNIPADFDYFVLNEGE